MNTKLHAVTNANDRPLSFFITAGQVHCYTSAAALPDDLPKAQCVMACRGYDAEWFRDALERNGTSRAFRGKNPAYAHKNEINIKITQLNFCSFKFIK